MLLNLLFLSLSLPSLPRTKTSSSFFDLHFNTNHLFLPAFLLTHSLIHPPSISTHTQRFSLCTHSNSFLPSTIAVAALADAQNSDAGKKDGGLALGGGWAHGHDGDAAADAAGVVP